ncbi:MAG: nucleoside kinase [Lachnospiraceae bacterium]|jgi:uridine kinase|nr:nucleoside kinase [Lachnospiraceae bacterium]
MKVTVNGVVTEYHEDATFEEVASDHQQEYKNEIALVIANGKIHELHKKVKEDCAVSFLTLRDSIGHRAYVRTVKMMFLKAITEIVGRDELERVKIEFAVGNGYYCTVKGNVQVTEELAGKIRERMLEMARKDLLITKKYYPMAKCMKLIRKYGMKDKEKLFRYRRSSGVNLYCLDGFYDYYYGYMLPSTGYVKHFQVIAYDEGFMLVMPDEKEPFALKPFRAQEKLFGTLKESSDWSTHAGIENVGELNDVICSNRMQEMILLQEAEQERRIGEIAREVVRHSHVKFVMIAGPSSSGKTSFANRISIQLRALGKVPHLISLDDYFVNREDTPRDEKGDFNFECLGAIDVEMFNRDMLKLLGGEEVELPSFNFKIGRREYDGHMMKLEEEDILVIEGIHGLNPKMSYSLPEDSKFKIYISALTSLNIDDHNRIPTTDGRLLRRIVRDARTRNSSAKRTIQMWPSVRRGEEENIFPFQEEADVMFNSVLVYELAVLKQYAEPLLFGIREGEPEFYEAKRLLRFLNYFLGVDSASIPNNSICREFVGGSCFKV